jgi:hypothetical protein
MSDEEKINDKTGPTRILPDLAICRAKLSGVIDLAYCLVDEPYGCKYAEPHRDKVFCFHPTREEIIARTHHGQV